MEGRIFPSRRFFIFPYVLGSTFFLDIFIEKSILLYSLLKKLKKTQFSNSLLVDPFRHSANFSQLFSIVLVWLTTFFTKARLYYHFADSFGLSDFFFLTLTPKNSSTFVIGKIYTNLAPMIFSYLELILQFCKLPQGE